MKQKKPQAPINFRLLLLTIVSAVLLSAFAFNKLKIDFDILNSLPESNPVIADAKYLFANHPLQDQVIIDIGINHNNLPELIKTATFFEAGLKASELFSSVGLKEHEGKFPMLLSDVTKNLPYLFNEAELNNKILPLLSQENISSQLFNTIQLLAGIQGVGQVSLISEDPLEFRNLVLARLADINPMNKAGFYQGFPLSADKKHVLIIASPKRSGTDTAQSRQITDLLDQLEQEINKDNAQTDLKVSITPMGSYRAALDNETIIRRDTQKAIIIATIGIAILLLVSFPRPYMGLLSLVPAIFGTISSFFLCALIYDSISVLALGFGGAIISITVDHSIAYLLFLDRREKVYVKEAAEEVRAIGLVAVLTTVGAFLVLTFSGFHILAQIGQFAAFGIAFSFIFVHTVLPKLIRVVPPARRKSAPKLVLLINHLKKIQRPIVSIILLIFMGIMAINAKPSFDIDLSSMNSVSEATLSAEKQISDTWGNISSKIHLLLEADTLDALQQQSDVLSESLVKAKTITPFKSPFTPSQVYPGDFLAEKNLRDWQEFWSEERIQITKSRIEAEAEQLGFSGDAFEPFFQKLQQSPNLPIVIPSEITEILGIRHDIKRDKWLMSTTITPGDSFDSMAFKQAISENRNLRVFDPLLFSAELGDLLASTFLKMLLIIGIAVIVILFLYFLDIKLTILATLPIAFALVCTLGTLNLLNHPLDIPGLMLSIIVFGMGIDYSLFMIRSYQRYGDESDPFHGLIRMAVFLAAISTLIGFGVLVSADHYLLYSAGLVSLLGIGYALIGSFFLLPPILRKLYAVETDPRIQGKTRFQRTISRYQKVEAFPRMFARMKIILDPMFQETDQFLEDPKHIIDIGCGYGVPAAWILDQYPNAKFYGLEPEAERVRVANRMLGKNGKVIQGYSPDLPKTDSPVDTVLMLDMLHYLDNDNLLQALRNAFQVLMDGGRLVIRLTIPVKENAPFYRWIETIQIRLRKATQTHRTLDEMQKALEMCGFSKIASQPSGKGREEVWITARAFK